MILDLIVSKNLARRQLNAGQRAFMALEYERYYAAAQQKGRPIGDGATKALTESEKTPQFFGEKPKNRESTARAALQPPRARVGCPRREGRRRLRSRRAAGEGRHPRRPRPCREGPRRRDRPRSPRIGDSPPGSPVRGPRRSPPRVGATAHPSLVAARGTHQCVPFADPAPGPAVYSDPPRGRRVSPFQPENLENYVKLTKILERSPYNRTRRTPT